MCWPQEFFCGQPKMRSEIKKRILEIPPSDFVASRSTPVVSFGNFEKAKVGTLGINPSSREFFEKKSLLKPSLKRLVDLDSLEIQNYNQINEVMAQEILNGCYNYFNVRPLEWFDDFENLMNAANYSYRDGTASHIDLVQWCTFPKWSSIPHKEQMKLLESDRGFFNWQFENNDMEVVVLGGRQVLEQVREIPGVTLKSVGRFHYMSGSRRTSVELCTMNNFKGKKLVGWSVNLQVMQANFEEKSRVIQAIRNFFLDEI